jgi:hypothetical protein
MFDVVIFGEATAQVWDVRTMIPPPVTGFGKVSQQLADRRFVTRPGRGARRPNRRSPQNRGAFQI